MTQRVRVYVACSLDGFIAGMDDDLSWLPTPDDAQGSDYGWGEFLATIGAVLMGRRTYDVASGFDAWPYEDRPVLVATTRPLESERATVRAVGGTIAELVDLAKQAAVDRDVYLDGANLIQQGLDEGLVDEITVTVVPVVLGEGIALFAGVSRRHEPEWTESSPLDGVNGGRRARAKQASTARIELELTANRDLGAGLVQLTYRCKGR